MGGGGEGWWGVLSVSTGGVVRTSQHGGDVVELAGVSTGGVSRGVHWWS